MKKLINNSILLVTLVLCGMLWMLLRNQQPMFDRVEQDYRDGRAINLSDQTSALDLKTLLEHNGYVANERDARFVADTLTRRLRTMRLCNIYDLQKRAYGKVSAMAADSAKVLTVRLDDSRSLLGQNDTLPALESLSAECRVDSAGQGEIRVQLFCDKKRKPQDLSNAIVRLTEYWVDTAKMPRDTVVGYAKTDSLGEAVFWGLNKERAYSVLPIKRGFEYGTTKGIALGKFKDDTYSFRFEQLEHRIQMISNANIKQIKSDGTITVRTPEEYKTTLIQWFILVMLAWWALVIILKLRKRPYDPLLLAMAMLLSGLCVLLMFAIHNPLTEDLRGVEMATGVIIGVVVIALFRLVDFVRLYQNNYLLPFDMPLSGLKWLFLPFKQKVAWLSETLGSRAVWYKKVGALLLLVLSLPFAVFNIPGISKINRPILRFLERLPKGFGWIVAAMLLTALLWTPLGREIGGMKVNLYVLGLTFQPSEIAKYLILFFMAAFFTQNTDAIIAYSQPNRLKIWSKFKTMSWVLFGMVALVGIYAKLGDMGPGLVIGVTFVLLYSLVKSKVNLDNLTENDKWRRIFTCDFAMLIYGVLSFGACILIGFHVGARLALFFALLWFVAWILMGIAWRKQVFETAIVMNLLIFLFVFGGQVMQEIPSLRDTDTAERFEQRTDMCVNTWGILDEAYNGKQAHPVINTQVVNGLWAIATGGMTGQGIGQGNPSFVPAFHTDMILSSIGEQLGWIGLALVALALGIMLRRMVVVGYKVGHPFAFYFCMGVAIVTGVQFFIIALGGSGMIPLTGIAVPLLSYGRVSMILNLAALGIILSMSSRIRSEKNAAQESIKHRSVGGYNFPIAIVTWTFVVMMLFTLGVWQYYALWQRNTTLVRPAYALNREGLPVIEYNPRIALITREMWAGNIYDRNGLLLATSDRARLDKESDDYQKLLDVNGLCDTALDSIAKTHTRRYYPFGEQLFFMVGDMNSGLLFTYDEGNPIGYMAEAQHLSYLRNYDNLHDRKGNPTKTVYLTSNKVKPDLRYLRSCERDTTIRYRLRDNHELVRYLKTGVNGRPLRKHNEDARDGDFDIHLTLDAELQVTMQNSLQDYIDSGNLTNNRLLRVSVVVLDAENGDLLTSANYPLPSYDKIREADKAGERYYNDNKREKTWRAYTDRDLGLTHATAPGSTAKVMTAMAGLNKLGANEGSHKAYNIQRYEAIDYKGGGLAEPPYGANSMVVEMRQALVESSNCYFIDLLHDCDLYEPLENIYANAGIRLDNKMTYALRYPTELNPQIIHPVVRRQHNDALTSWNKYQLDKNAGKYRNGQDKQTLRRGEWMWAWGQGTMDATPLAMARVVSAVQNRGRMPHTRYLMNEEKHTAELTTPEKAQALKEFMRGQFQKNSRHLGIQTNIGGKTGTPHRTLTPKGYRTGRNHRDGWYVFYMDNSATKKQSLAVAVRMERVGEGSSTTAMHLSRDVVIPVLEDYLSKQ